MARIKTFYENKVYSCFWIEGFDWTNREGSRASECGGMPRVDVGVQGLAMCVRCSYKSTQAKGNDVGVETIAQNAT